MEQRGDAANAGSPERPLDPSVPMPLLMIADDGAAARAIRPDVVVPLVCLNRS
jgi:hypothetical protein